jgi:hypothetical protein
MLTAPRIGCTAIRGSVSSGRVLDLGAGMVAWKPRLRDERTFTFDAIFVTAWAVVGNRPGHRPCGLGAMAWG